MVSGECYLRAQTLASQNLRAARSPSLQRSPTAFLLFSMIFMDLVAAFKISAHAAEGDLAVFLAKASA